METLKIERLGGLAGMGLPRSRLRSSGEQDMSAADRATVEALFHGSAEQRGGGDVRDGFRYKITRTVRGHEQTIEAPKAAVPPALKDCVVDELM